MFKLIYFWSFTCFPVQTNKQTLTLMQCKKGQNENGILATLNLFNNVENIVVYLGVKMH